MKMRDIERFPTLLASHAKSSTISGFAVVTVAVAVAVVEWLYYSGRVIIGKGADLSDFFVEFRR